MGEYKQDQRIGKVKTPLGEDVLLLAGFNGTDSLSSLFSYQVEMLAENKEKIDFSKILGQGVTVELKLPDGGYHHLNGICVKFAQSGRDQVFTRYRAELVPKVWLMTRKTQSRIFQQKNVPDILKEVFKGYDVTWELQGTFEPRDYCVQYRESDFAFGSRLMEEEGIYYFFKHSDGSHQMVVANTPSSHEMVPGESTFTYEELEGGYRDDNRILLWEKEQEIRSGKVTLWDHCFELPHRHLEAESIIHETVTAGSETHKLKLPGVDKLELYDWPGAYAQRFDGIAPGGGDRASDLQKIFQDNLRTADVRMDQAASEAVTIRGASNVKHLMSGFKFKLKRHFAGGDGEYVLTSVTHAARFAHDYRTNEGEGVIYQNGFTCVPSGLAFRPQRVTPRPTVLGCQTAVVVGPSGEEIFTDKYSRVKVQFHWDREGKNDSSSSCWVRVATFWAGRQWGAIHIPRIGQEVVVDFLEGDPDQPIIVGSVYNADQMPPYTLPDNKTQSGIKSRSSLGGGTEDFNEIRLEDKKGSEQLFIHAQKDQDIEVEHDESHWVGNDRTKTIDHDETVHVKHDRTETVDNDETITIKHDRTETVMHDQTVTVTNNDTKTVGQQQSLTVGSSRTKTVGASETITIAASETMNVGGTLTIQSTGAIQVTAGGVTTLQSGGAISITTGAAMSVSAGGAVSINVAGAASISVAGAATIQAGAAVSISAGGAVAVNATAITLNAAMVTCAGVLMATTVMTSSVVSAAYTPGVGNMM